MLYKNTFFIVFYLFFSFSVQAQNVYVGLQGEFFNSSFSVDANLYEFEPQTGFGARLLCRLPLTDLFALQFEAGYMQRKLRGEYGFETNNALDPFVLYLYSADQNIIDLGMTFRFQRPAGKVRPYFAPGFGVGMLNDPALTYTRDGSWYRSRTFAKVDLNVLFEGGVVFPFGEGGLWAVEPGVRYALTLNNLKEGPSEAKHRRFGLVVAVTRGF